jgi:hypothetical protein
MASVVFTGIISLSRLDGQRGVACAGAVSPCWLGWMLGIAWADGGSGCPDFGTQPP